MRQQVCPAHTTIHTAATALANDSITCVLCDGQVMLPRDRDRRHYLQSRPDGPQLGLEQPMAHELVFGAWISRRRKALDLTQVKLARRIGCAKVTLQKIELGGCSSYPWWIIP